PGADQAPPQHLPNIPPAPPAPPAPAAPLHSAPAAEPIATSPVLDEGTYEKLREPRGAGRIDLDGKWHQISPRYVVSQFLQNGILLAVVIAAALILGLVLHQSWIWIPAGIIGLMIVFTLVILP